MGIRNFPQDFRSFVRDICEKEKNFLLFFIYEI